MRSASIRFSGMLILGIVLGGRPARAEFIDWSYRWSIGPAPVFASGTGTVAEALYRGAGERGAQLVRVAAVTTSSSATAQNPDHFNKSFTLVLHLTDAQSHQARDLTFHGTIAGTLTSSSSRLTESFRDPIQRVMLGRHEYTVRLQSQLALLRPGAPVVPFYAAAISVKDTPIFFNPLMLMSQGPLVQTASIQAAPEPSSLALAGIGVVVAGCLCLWRWRRCAMAGALTASLAGPCG